MRAGAGDYQGVEMPRPLKARKREPRRRQKLPEGTKRWGGTVADEYEERRRRAGGQDWGHDPPWEQKVPGPWSRPVGGGGGLINGRGRT